MRYLPLSQGFVTWIDDEDYAWASQWKWYAHRQARSHWYAARSAYLGGGRRHQRRRTILLHRELLHAGPRQLIDHANRDSLDNQRGNLRFCTPAQNKANAIRHRNCRSRFKGVRKLRHRPNRWTARISVEGRRLSLGCFQTEEAAAQAYNEAAKNVFGVFARGNVVEI